MEKWFVCNNDIVDGPFSKDQVERFVKDGTYPDDVLIWGKALNVWKPFRWWLDHYDSILSEAAKATDPRKWHFAYKGESQGPMNKNDLVEELKKLKGDANDALIWTKGMTNWAPIFEFHDIMDEVGVNRRHFPRAPVSGQIILMNGDQKITGVLNTVSEGGFGASDFNSELAPGMILKLELDAPEIGSTIHASAQVRYMDSETVGFKFTNINREAQSQIISYVKEKSFEMLSKLKVAA